MASNKKKKRKSKIVKTFSMDTVYLIINKAQTSGEEKAINVPLDSVPIIENIIKDCNISYKKVAFKEFVRYLFLPSEISFEDQNFDDIEEFPDEITDNRIVY